MPTTRSQLKLLRPSNRMDRHGWIELRIAGSPAERGFQHGYWLAPELRGALKSIRHLILMDTGVPFDWFAANAAAMYLPVLQSNWEGKLADQFGVEILEELQGIVDGANANRTTRGAKITLTDLLGWNGYPELICQWWPAVQAGKVTPAVPLPSGALASAVAIPPRHHFHHSCSAFVACGEQTRDGDVVIAQTTWQRFANGDAYNIILDLKPERGERLLMQSVPGYVYSSTDFCVTGAQLGVAETSLNCNGFDPTALPEFLRMRRACQFADSISAWCDLFKFGNNGGYVNTWLLADARKRSIAAYELTLQHDVLHPVLETGYYASCNIALSPAVRNLDCSGPSGFDNIQMSGGRRTRFEQLMRQHRGQLDPVLARAVLADHGDLYTREESPSSRTICGHFDVDQAQFPGVGQGPNYPWGSLDGKVAGGQMIRDLQLDARWGRACGTPFDANAFFRENPQYEWMKGHTKSRPTQPWTTFPTE